MSENIIEECKASIHHNENFGILLGEFLEKIENNEEVIGGRIGNHPGMKLQPAFVEWMMGLPIGWTDLNRSETP